MKRSISIFILFINFVFNAFAQNALKVDTSSLQITKFYTRIGLSVKDSIWNINQEIKLPSQPTFLSITIKDNKDSIPNFECLLVEPIKIYEKIKVGENNTVNFFNLTGGDYTITFTNLHNKNTKEINFKIEPVFWEKWWFSPFVFLIISIILGLTFYFFYLIRLRQQLRTQFMRDNIARDLHDDVGSTLSSIAILTQVAQNQMLNAPEKTKNLLFQISENAQEMLDNMSDIVWTNKSLNDNFEQLMVRMQEFSAKVLEPKDIEYAFNIDESLKEIKWNPQKYYDFYMIFKEAMNNAVKYSEANHLIISVLKEKNHLFLKIEDNGKGFDQNNQKAGNGIANMKKRAEQLKGTFLMESVINEGTKIEVRIPI